MFVQLSDEFYPLLSEHGNTIQLLADEDLTVYADPVKLARVFNNILKNAIYYSYPDTEIIVSGKKYKQILLSLFKIKVKPYRNKSWWHYLISFSVLMMHALPIQGERD